MSRTLFKLTARQIKTLPDGMHNDGGGLYLRAKGNSRSWVFRFTHDGRKREMGLGSLDAVPLARAREKAQEARELVAQGMDPVEVRKAPQSAAVAAPALTGGRTFKQAMDGFLDLNLSQWKNPKHRQQWVNTLNTYAAPLMTKPVGEITVDDVEAILVPIWTVKPETASRVRGRIERVLGYAMAKRWCKGPNIASWRGNLEHILPRQKPSERHHAAVPWDNAPEAFQTLWAKRDKGQGTRALLFCVLGAMRSGEVRGLRWDEVHADHILIPGDRMKAGKPHRVPITGPMRLILDNQPRMVGSPYVFPSSRQGMISDMTMSKSMKTSGIVGTPHGWRSTFSDWANAQGHRREYIEDQLAHVVGSDAERAYRREDWLRHRVSIMAEWAGYLLAE